MQQMSLTSKVNFYAISNNQEHLSGRKQQALWILCPNFIIPKGGQNCKIGPKPNLTEHERIYPLSSLFKL